MESRNRSARCRKSNGAFSLCADNTQEVSTTCATLHARGTITHNATGKILVKTGNLQGILDIDVGSTVHHSNRGLRIGGIKTQNTTHCNYTRRHGVIEFTVKFAVRYHKIAGIRNIVITQKIRHTENTTHRSATRNHSRNDFAAVFILCIDIQVVSRATNGLVQTGNATQSRPVPRGIVMNIDLYRIVFKRGIFCALRTDRHTGNTTQEHIMANQSTSRLINFLRARISRGNRNDVRNMDIVVARDV